MKSYSIANVCNVNNIYNKCKISSVIIKLDIKLEWYQVEGK